MKDRSRTSRGVRVGLAMLAVGASALVGQWAAPAMRSADAQETLRLHAGEQFTLRFGKRLKAKRLARFLPELRELGSGVERAFEARIGRYVWDRATRRRVVVRPETIAEWLMVTDGLPATAATVEAGRLLDRIEKSGGRRRLARLERRMTPFLLEVERPLRLDTDDEWEPAPGSEARRADKVALYAAVAGNPADWRAALAGDAAAEARLSGAERFALASAPAGSPFPTTSRFGLREHRRVLVDRSRKRELIVMPRLPTRTDLSDGALAPEAAYELIAPAKGRPRNRVFTRWLGAVSFTEGRLAFDVRPADVLAGPDSVDGFSGESRPRVVDVTPPHGDAFVSPDTDWEAPEFTPAGPDDTGRPFVIRLRFDRPLAPYSVSAATVQLYRVASDVSAGGAPVDPPVFVPVEVGLEQSQLGKVEITVRPEQRLDDDATYRVIVQPVVRSLSGRFPDRPLTSEFTTAPAR